MAEIPVHTHKNRKHDPARPGTTYKLELVARKYVPLAKQVPAISANSMSKFTFFKYLFTKARIAPQMNIILSPAKNTLVMLSVGNIPVKKYTGK